MVRILGYLILKIRYLFPQTQFATFSGTAMNLPILDDQRSHIVCTALTSMYNNVRSVMLGNECHTRRRIGSVFSGIMNTHAGHFSRTVNHIALCVARLSALCDVMTHALLCGRLWNLVHALLCGRLPTIWCIVLCFLIAFCLFITFISFAQMPLPLLPHNSKWSTSALGPLSSNGTTMTTTTTTITTTTMLPHPPINRLSRPSCFWYSAVETVTSLQTRQTC